MYTVHTTQNTIHASELMVCGCRVCPTSGARFITCPDHAKLPVDPLAKKGGLNPLCPVCSSQHLKPVGINIFCRDCEALFAASDITGYGLSDDGQPKKCACGAVHYGRTDTCDLCSLPEAAL